MTASAQQAAPARTGGTNPFAWKFTTPLYVGAALNPVNSSLIATALVPIATALHVSVGSATVLVSSLYLASAIAQPTAGKLAEEFGPRRVFLTGILLVLLGGLLGGSGQNMAMLTAARVLIGVGTSAGYPSAMILIRRRANSAGMSAPPGGVLGGIAIAGMATAAVGPPIGGILVGGLGWRSAFLINIPVALLALGMAARWVPRDPPAAGRRGAREIAARIDVLGIAGFGGAMTALLVFLMGLPRTNWVAFAVAVVLAAMLVWWELHTPTPFFDIRQLGRNGALTRTYLRSALTLLGTYTVLYGVTQWMEAGRGFSTQEAGLLLLPMGALAALVSRPLSQRNLIRSPLIAAAVSMLIGSLGILILTTHSPVALIVVVTLVFGVCVATTTVGNQTALYTQAPADQIGTASGLSRTFGYIGSIASATVTGIVFRHGTTDSGLHSIAVVLIIAGAIVLAMTLLDRRLKTPAANTGQPDAIPAKENT
ncbi:MFS transporter [Actinacidiphila oryziradicis]|uniref:MFS transporter n=1 Tax=Actinacidiphila oryziradicis TaxID=2571141 RepID=UPI0023F3DBF9|nr:MFS transporter [Actinacidiphila oryziradicis]MCW2872954.1 transporter [Actinacidiphila oryziradicis]